MNEIIQTVPSVPPETGGLIGGTDFIVSRFILDSGVNHLDRCDIYEPDISLLNETIQIWQQNGIELYGIFHSHFPGGTSLSFCDKRYITQIMQSMPQHIKHLYFPIVLPGEEMIVYRANKVGQTILLVSEDIEYY